MSKLLKILMPLIVLFGASYASVDKPLKLIVQRAELMQGIGLCKLQTDSSIYDSAQERKVLQTAENIAKANHFDEKTFLIFIQLQMDLSKQIEAYYWQLGSKEQINSQTIDCLASYRVKIKNIDEQLYTSIGDNLQELQRDDRLVTKLEELVKEQQIKGIPQNPNYLDLIAQSLHQLRNK